MITRTTLKTMATALFLATAIAGCGDSDDDRAAAPAGSTATTPASTPPVNFENVPQADPSKPAGKKEQAWAKRLCTSMVGRMSAIQPPTVAASTPEATLESLTAFFGNVVEQQDSQVTALEEVGAPPTSKAKTEWKKALDELKSVRKDVNGVVDGLKESKADSEQEITALVGSLQQQLGSLGSYGGPIKALYASEDVGQALLAEPTCEKVG